MYALLNLGNSLSRVETLGTHFGTVHDLMTPIQLVSVIHLGHSFLCEVIARVNDPPAAQADCNATLSTVFILCQHKVMLTSAKTEHAQTTSYRAQVTWVLTLPFTTHWQFAYLAAR